MTHTAQSQSSARRSRRRLIPAAGVLALAVAVVASLAAVATAGPTKRSAVPANSGRPVLQGTFQVKEVVTATTGTWSNTPTAYTYQWQRCSASGTSCVNVATATNKTFTLSSDDKDHTLVVLVTAANGDGTSTAAASRPSPVVSDDPAPHNGTLPAVSGTAKSGEQLQVSNGTWTGGVSGYTYRWQRCDENGNDCVNVTGATAATYGVKNADAGSTLRAAVTAQNSTGSTTAYSDRSAVVGASTPTTPPANPTGCTPGGPSTVAAADLNLPVRLQLDRFEFSPSKVSRSNTSFTGRFHVGDTCGRSVSGAQVWSTAVPYNQTSEESATTGADGWAAVTFKLESGFPANPGKQQILAMIVQVTKPGGNVLNGVSTTRVVRQNVGS